MFILPPEVSGYESAMSKDLDIQVRRDDHHTYFNDASDDYRLYRPRYPDRLYEEIIAHAEGDSAVWDCATGNGQSAVSLTKYFDRVYASDVSRQQIESAIDHERVSYSVQAAEKTDFEDGQFDAICVAQALHWFDYEKFWSEVRRVLKPGGLFAAWGYDWFRVDPESDRMIEEKLLHVIRSYWSERNELLWNKYADVPFPLREIDIPEMEMSVEWSATDLIGFVKTWSATKLCIKEIGTDFLDELHGELEKLWGSAEDRRKATCRLHAKFGRFVD